jgi:co-chaperonin GroES (HSP10)
MIATPFGTTILLKPLSQQKETSGGLYLPEEKKQMVNRPGKGEVMAVGEKVASGIAIGDTLFFDKYKSIEVEIDKDTFWIAISEEEILKCGGKFVQ